MESQMIRNLLDRYGIGYEYGNEQEVEEGLRLFDEALSDIGYNIRSNIITYEDIYNMWLDSLGERPSDYRPISTIFLEDTNSAEGIIVWLENGDKIVYYPNLEGKETNNERMETL